MGDRRDATKAKRRHVDATCAVVSEEGISGVAIRKHWSWMNFEGHAWLPFGKAPVGNVVEHYLFGIDGNRSDCMGGQRGLACLP